MRGVAAILVLVSCSATALSAQQVAFAASVGVELDSATQAVVTAPIVGASKLSHLDEAIEAANITLSPEETEAVERAMGR